jgi:HK97 family phage portal protein
MGLLDGFRALFAPNGSYDYVTYVGPTVSEALGMDADDMFRTQPHLRTVITFIARNIAQLPLHTFVRVGENDRRRERNDPFAQLLAHPNPAMTQYDLIYRLIADLKLHDVALWMLAENPERPSGWELWPIPYSWVQSTSGGSAWAPKTIRLIRPGAGRPSELTNEPGKTPQFFLFHGYNPSDPSGWSSPVAALKDILAEQIKAWQYRQQVWDRGGRVGSYLTRPPGVEWSPEARTQFATDWKAKWTGNGPKAGGTPILEDGMELKSTRFTSREEEWSEVAKLSLATVAGVYHTSPTMVGILDNANYSNVREFKQMLYTDTLGPDLAYIEAYVNDFIRPWITKAPDSYAEFNVAEKLQGNFEEQAAVISTSVGRPWMTADEARARFNMPALGGDAEQLVTPLNVLVGGQASPRDSAPDPQQVSSEPELLKALAFALLKQIELPAPVAAKALTREPGGPVQVKSEVDPEHAAMVTEVLRRFYKRQRTSVLARLGGKSHDWWDEDRWNEELAADLYALAMTVTEEVGRGTMTELGIEPDRYDPAKTAAFLKAVAESRAGAINSTTRDQIAAALDGDLDEDAEGATPEGVFDLAESSRLEQGATVLATTLVGFAVMEAAAQTRRENTTKTWNVQSSNPRSSHARMDGETVPVDEPFSNGAMWPGDAVLGVDENAGCQCGVTVSIP